MSSVSGISKVPELRKRILFTVFAIVVYRFGVHVPTPGIDAGALSSFFSSAGGTIFGVFNMFSGGALSKFSIFALGIMPYISSSIMMQLLTIVVPSIDRLSKEGELGKRKITQYTRYATIILALVQGFFIAKGLEQLAPSGVPVVENPGMYFKLMTMLTLATGTMFLMWLGEQITERGIGNGISLIIFAGIASGIPGGFFKMVDMFKSGQIMAFTLLFLLALMLFVSGFIVFMERSQRRIPVQYAKRVVGRKVYGGVDSHLPLKLNSAGVIPAIFASAVILFPATIAQYVDNPMFKELESWFAFGSVLYNVVFLVLIIFFTYFYTAVTFNPVDVAENLKRQGGFIPGIRPGKQTSDYIDKILTRITFIGAMYLASVSILPYFLIAKWNIPFYFGGTSLLILIGVALDTITQVESYLLTRHYDSFMQNSKMKGRR